MLRAFELNKQKVMRTQEERSKELRQKGKKGPAGRGDNHHSVGSPVRHARELAARI